MGMVTKSFFEKEIKWIILNETFTTKYTNVRVLNKYQTLSLKKSPLLSLI